MSVSRWRDSSASPLESPAMATAAAGDPDEGRMPQAPPGKLAPMPPIAMMMADCTTVVTAW